LTDDQGKVNTLDRLQKPSVAAALVMPPARKVFTALGGLFHFGANFVMGSFLFPSRPRAGRGIPTGCRIAISATKITVLSCQIEIKGYFSTLHYRFYPSKWQSFLLIASCIMWNTMWLYATPSLDWIIA